MARTKQKDAVERARGLRNAAIGATGALVAGDFVGRSFSELRKRNMSGEPFPMYGQMSDQGAISGPSAESMLKERERDPLVLDRAKMRAERMRTGVRLPTVAFGQDMAGHDGKKFITLLLSSSDAPTAFHEMGHAAQDDVLTRLHGKMRSATVGAGPLTVGDGLRTGFLIGAVSHPTSRFGKAVHDNAALLTGLTEIPVLMEELRASYSALKGLHAIGGAAAVKGGLRSLAPALATFLADSASHVGAVALARHMAGGHEKTAAGAAAPAATAAGAGAAPGAAGGGGGAKAPTLGVPKMPSQPKVTGALRLSSIAANATPIGQLKPKTTPPHPGNRRGNFPGIPTAKPPSLTGYYRDTLDSMDAPSRGTRT